MKPLFFLILLSPAFGFSQKTSNNPTEKPYVTYCNEDGSKKLNYTPLCDSLNVSDKNLKISSFTFKVIDNEKIITEEMTNNKLSGTTKNMIKFSKAKVIYFEEIKAINTKTNKEISLPALKITWEVN